MVNKYTVYKLVTDKNLYKDLYQIFKKYTLMYGHYQALALLFGTYNSAIILAMLAYYGIVR